MKFSTFYCSSFGSVRITGNAEVGIFEAKIRKKISIAGDTLRARKLNGDSIQLWLGCDLL